MKSKHTCMALLGLAVTMANCTTVPAQAPVVFSLDTPDHVSPIKVEDQRQPEEKMLRPRTGASSIYRLGDENFVPDRLRALALRFGNTLGPVYTDKTIAIEYFEVTIFNPPAPRRPGGPGVFVPSAGAGVPGLIGSLILGNLMTSTSETHEGVIVVCEIRGSVNLRFFKGSSDRVVSDPQADLFDVVSAVVREAIDDAADNVLKILP